MDDAGCVAGLLRRGRERLHASDSAALDAQMLLCHCLQKNRSYLMAWPEATVEPAVAEQYWQLITRRENGEPVAYLTGQRDFWTLTLQCKNSTLIPRPETEMLVDVALTLCDAPQARVLDLGTGTGAIALALASERPRWHIQACDLVPEAVALAEQNRSANRLHNVVINQSNWFEQINSSDFNLIVSNPPYIDEQDHHLKEGDVRFEPHSALVADNHGMAAIEHITTEAKNYLCSDGWLLFEHGYDQAERARQLLKLLGYRNVQSWRDLAGIERVTGGKQ